MTMRQHKRRYCGKFWAVKKRRSVFNFALPMWFRSRPYSRCNPVTYGG
jgi:hypothetical protein